MAMLTLRISCALIGALATIDIANSNPPARTPDEPAESHERQTTRLALATAPRDERDTLQRLLIAPAWPRRAVGALRLERYRCDDSRSMLTTLLRDSSWQVRAFAVRTLARRRVAQQPHWFAEESEPRVVRTALRNRYQLDHERIDRGVRILARSNDLQDKMLAVELGVTSSDPDTQKLVLATAKQIILKMNRGEAGMLSSRLAAMTGQRGLRRAYQWQNWLIKTGRAFAIKPVFVIDEGSQLPEPNLLAQLDSEAFCNLEEYITKLGERDVDLAIVLDCTASMSGEIAAAQAGIDEMMLFVGDVVASLRVGVVAYRDRRDEFETKVFEFTDDIAAARQQVWTLEADGGGDSPEAVYPALKAALSELAWRPKCDKVLILVGDAPPHIGFGSQCESMIAKARDATQLTTHVIQAEGKEVKHFREIAKAGGGKCVSLENDDTLMAEVTGLAIGDRYENEFREFFRIHLELCR